jgi:hypothetical protein
MKTKITLGKSVKGNVVESVKNSVWILTHISLYRSVNSSVYNSVFNSVWRPSFIL